MAVDEAPWTTGFRGTSPGAKAHLSFCGICGPTKVVPFLQNLKPVLYFAAFAARDPPTGWVPRPCPFTELFYSEFFNRFYEALKADGQVSRSFGFWNLRSG